MEYLFLLVVPELSKKGYKDKADISYAIFSCRDKNN